MIRFNCPTCGAALSAPDQAAGKAAPCKKCGETVRVPTAVVPAPERGLDAPTRPAGGRPPVPLDPPAPTARAETQDDYKPCPFCGEAVLAVAKKCKHCGETLDVAMRAADEARKIAERASRSGQSSGAAAASASAVVHVHHQKRCNHLLHFVLTLLTCGMWDVAAHLDHRLDMQLVKERAKRGDLGRRAKDRGRRRAGPKSLSE